jgi:hypothetical protein
MHTTIFIFYALLLCLAITRMQFFKDCIKPVYLVLLFIIHVSAGCIHTWIAFRYFPHHGDVWYFFQESIRMKQDLLAHPGQFLDKMIINMKGMNVVDNNQQQLLAQYAILQYVDIFLNFISFDNLYVNTLLFSFLVFTGSIALFKVFYTAYNKPLPAFCTLLLPSVLFWTSELYKDGIFYMAIGFFLYILLKPRKQIILNGILILICLYIMILSRANAIITLLPALFFFFLSQKKWFGKKVNPVVVLAAVILTAVFINYVIPGGLLIRVSERQKEFQLLTGSSKIYLPALEPTATGFLTVFPLALANGFFQPLPGAGGKSVYNLFSIELLIVWIIILYACWLLIRKKTIKLSNFDISCLLFALPGLIVIGYMIPFAGAIIRYRSIYLPFLLAPFVNVICDYPVKSFLSINNWLGRNVIVSERN